LAASQTASGAFHPGAAVAGADIVTPDDTSLPAYATLNPSLTQKVPIDVSRGTQVRLDVINVTDAIYQLRDGSGVGVGAPQYGMRRAFFVTLAQKF
jgi:hypothetical protein